MTHPEGPRAAAPPAHDLADALEASLDPSRRSALASAREISRERDEALYLVGGAVRDLLLGLRARPSPDLDLVVVGDGPGFARELARRLDAEVEPHRSFLTARVDSPVHGRLDLASSRREIYDRPGALPRVEPASLLEDLARRDFTVNALALELAPVAGRLVDPHGGQADLERRRLRVLHPASFTDDPSRILRGLEFEDRLDFRFEAATEEMARRALSAGGLRRLGPDRLAAALRPLLARALDSAPARRRMAQLGVPAAVHPALTLGAAQEARIARFAQRRRALTALAEPDDDRSGEPAAAVVVALALVWELDPSDRVAASAALGAGGEADPIAAGVDPAELEALALRLDRPGLAPHAVAALLRGRSGLELVALAAEGGERVSGWVEREVAEFRPLRLRIGGRDLLELGFAPGPPIGRALEATRDARLDGRIGPGEELDFAVARLRASEENG